MNTEEIPLGMFSDAIDYELTDDGQLSPRLGFEPYTDLTTPDGKPVRTIYPADWDGSVKLMVATSDHVYHYDITLGTWTSIYAIPTTTAKRMTFALLNGATSPLLVFGNGTDPLQKWNGTTTSACAGAPAGRPVAYKNYLAVFDVSGQPGRVQFSINPGDPDTWLYGGVARFLEMRGKVTAVFPYVGLMVFSSTRTEIFHGDPDAPSGMQTLSETIGCVAYETIADCGGVVRWLSQAGVMEWDGGGSFPARNVSNPAADVGNAYNGRKKSVYSSVQRDIDRAVWEEEHHLSACYLPSRNAYLLAMRIRAVAAGASVWRVFVYFASHQAWFPWSAEHTALATLIVPSDKRQILLGGTTSGVLRRPSTRYLKDIDISGGVNVETEYEFWAKSGDYDFGDPDSDKTLRRVSLATQGQIGDRISGNRTFQIYLWGEFGRTGMAAPSIDISTGGFILGINVLGDALTTSQRFVEASTPCALRAKHFTFKVFGKGAAQALAVSALCFHVRPGSQRVQLVSNL